VVVAVRWPTGFNLSPAQHDKTENTGNHMAKELPERTRVYQCHHLDSTRWDDFTPRPDDIIITTSLKAGTTWMQRIVSLLVFQSTELPQTRSFGSPWIDARFIGGTAELLRIVEALEHRRFFKTHLAFDAIPYWENAKDIFVGRDTRDVFMSLWNHVNAYTPMMIAMLNSGENAPSTPFMQIPEDIRGLCRVWITRGSYSWEQDGYPYWSHHHHARTYWEHRHLPNLL